MSITNRMRLHSAFLIETKVNHVIKKLLHATNTFSIFTENTFQMETKKNIGIWIRVSTEMQVQQDSPEHHEKRARLYAEAKGWHVAEVYRLEAVSGKSVLEHAEAKRMLKDVEAGTISGLIFSKLARLARNTKELLEFAEIFKMHNADLISLAESIDTSSPAGRLFYTIIAAMATWEREEIAERVAASVPIRAKLGKPLSASTSLGYRWVDKQFVVDEKEAPVRKLIYDLFLKTKRKKATAKALNDMGYRTRKGGLFTHTTIDRLLRDSTAKGIRKANYTTARNQKGNGSRIKPKEEWVLMPCPAIISEEVWEECNALLKQQESKYRKPGPRSVHLLSGFLHCECGNKMYVYHRDKYPTYRCKACNTKILVEDIDAIYHEQLKGFLFTEQDISSYLLRTDSEIFEKQEHLSYLQTEYEKLKKKIDDLVALRLANELSRQTFGEQFKPLETRKEQLENQIPMLEAEIDFLRIQHLNAGEVLSEAKNLYHNWLIMSFEERRSIVETITEQLVIHKDTIDIRLSHLPAPHLSQKAGKSERLVPNTARG